MGPEIHLARFSQPAEPGDRAGLRQHGEDVQNRRRSDNLAGPPTIERNRRRLAVSLLQREEISGPSRPEEEEGKWASKSGLKLLAFSRL